MFFDKRDWYMFLISHVLQTNQQRYSFYDKAIHRACYKDDFDVWVLKVAFNDS